MFLRVLVANTPMALCDVILQVADTLSAKAIVVFTSRGTTVQKAAQLRPTVPVMGVTPNIETARGLALTWGVYPCVINPDSEDVNFRMMLFKVNDRLVLLFCIVTSCSF